MDPDPDPEGPKTCGSSGSGFGSGTESATLLLSTAYYNTLLREKKWGKNLDDLAFDDMCG
jgi:hypothetical protein